MQAGCPHHNNIAILKPCSKYDVQKENPPTNQPAGLRIFRIAWGMLAMIS